ncbi:MAG TPA: hypothetical protein VN600_03850 [Gemmatimonadaceae bacterium]|nr:hypothetical protein [Gemmatimonadaceae bacterium]
MSLIRAELPPGSAKAGEQGDAGGGSGRPAIRGVSPTPAAAALGIPAGTPTSTPAVGLAPPAASVLSRELGDFLVELSIAVHKHAIYPTGHPLLDGAADSVTRTLWGLLAERPLLSLGVARRQLVIEGVATDPNHPLLQELAQRLHRHHLGAIKFERGVERTELADFLVTISVDAGRSGKPVGLETDTLGMRWTHIRAFPLSYDRLELLEGEDGAPTESQMASGRAAELWVGLATAALAAETTGMTLDDDTPLEPAAVAKAIDEHSHEQAYDQVIVGYMLQIANELTANGAAGAHESAALQARISKMLGALKPDTLSRLLDMGGDVAQRRQFLLDATQGMSADAVVYLVRAAARTEKQTVSHSMVRLLAKLAKHADTPLESRRVMADRSLRDTVTRLVSEWTLSDPNPDAYRAVLEQVSRAAPAAGGTNATRAADCEPERIVKMALEIGAVGATLWRAVDRMEREGRAAQLLDLVVGAPDRDTADAIVRHVADSGPLRRILTADRVDFATAERIVERAGAMAIPVILSAAAGVSDPRRREHVYDLVAALGDAAPPVVARRLADADRGSLATEQRDLIALLGRLAPGGVLPIDVDLRRYLTHADTQVRREAVKVLLRAGGTARDEALAASVDDADARIVYLGLTAAGERCPRHVVNRIRLRVERGELDPSLRVLGIRAAATARTPETLNWLTSRAARPSRFFGRLSLLPATPESIAAVGAIAAGWRNDPGARQLMQLAMKSRDAQYRAAVRAQPAAASAS